MKRPTIFQLNLLMQFPRDGSYVTWSVIKNPNGSVIKQDAIRRLIMKGYITEDIYAHWRFRLTDEMITYLNGVKIK